MAPVLAAREQWRSMWPAECTGTWTEGVDRPARERGLRVGGRSRPKVHREGPGSHWGFRKLAQVVTCSKIPVGFQGKAGSTVVGRDQENYKLRVMCNWCYTWLKCIYCFWWNYTMAADLPILKGQIYDLRKLLQCRVNEIIYTKCLRHFYPYWQ